MGSCGGEGKKEARTPPEAGKAARLEDALRAGGAKGGLLWSVPRNKRLGSKLHFETSGFHTLSTLSSAPGHVPGQGVRVHTHRSQEGNRVRESQEPRDSG
eukprot:13611890-Alexandrium_andersonii.AAC.1